MYSDIWDILLTFQVFHGADSDIIWLERDFDIYIVNLFDTYHATNVLSKLPSGLIHDDAHS